MMDQTCFYCDNQMSEKNAHHVSFLIDAADRNETLCDICYKDWLEGIKD